MYTAGQRASIFWNVCIPLRAAIATYALGGNRRGLRVAALVIGGRWVLGMEVGKESYFGGPTWWADQRRLHGVLWLLYAAHGRGEWLALDTAFGASNWVREHGLMSEA